MRSLSRPVPGQTLVIVILWVMLTVPILNGAAAPFRADSVVIKKSSRELLLYQGSQVIRRYPIGLGQSPVGDKHYEGDSRTPEGHYRLDYRNPNSRYHLSLHVSYPSRMDIIRARQRGLAPGGAIMIHGMPNDPDAVNIDGRGPDWTAGCIAVSNPAIEEIWDLVPDNTPIEIRP